MVPITMHSNTFPGSIQQAEIKSLLAFSYFEIYKGRFQLLVLHLFFLQVLQYFIIMELFRENLEFFHYAL